MKQAPYKAAFTAIAVTLSISACSGLVNSSLMAGGMPGANAGNAQVHTSVNSFVLGLGEEKSLSTLLRTGDGAIASQAFVWTSSNDGVLSIHPSTGLAKAVKTGEAVVTAAALDNPALRVTLLVSVVESRSVLLIKVSPDTPTLQVGDKVPLRAQVHLADGQVNGNVTWNSSDDTIATVNQSTGEVSALRVGKVTVVASYTLDPKYKGLAEITIVQDRSQVPTAATPTPIVFQPGATPLPSAPHAAATPEGPAGAAGQVKFDVEAPTHGIAIDQADGVWVTHRTTGSVTKLSPAGAVVGTYPAGAKPGPIAIDGAGNAWILNQGSRSVTKLATDGATLGTFPIASLSSDFYSDIAADRNGNIVIATGGTKVLKLSSAGAVVESYDLASRAMAITVSRAGQIAVARFSGLSLIATDGGVVEHDIGGDFRTVVRADSSGTLWVVSGNGQVSRFTSEGGFVQDLSSLTWPKGLAVDASDALWVTRWASPAGNVSGDGLVTRLSRTGKDMATYKVPSNPGGIATDSHGRAWVTSSSSTRVSRITP